MLIVKDLTYKVNFVDTIFENISFTIKEKEKVSIIGKNGIGKSILLNLIVGNISQFNGEIVKKDLNISYFPQKFNELNFKTVADVFGLHNQVTALNNIENNNADINDYEYIDGHWDCKDIIKEKMKIFGLNFEPLRNFNTLSGGEKVKLIISSIINKNSNFLILDEPTNNMDYESKKIFYDFIRSWNGGVLLVSHDRELLNLMDRTMEMRKIGIAKTKLFNYGGNFKYWQQQKFLEEQALENSYNNSIKKEEIKRNEAIRTTERLKKGFAKSGRLASDGSIKAARTLQQMNREKTALKQVANSKATVEKCNNNISLIQEKMEIQQNIYFKFSKTTFSNKNLVNIENLYFFYNTKQIFNDFNLEIKSHDRVAVEGSNGSGKTTLLNIINGKITDYRGKIKINTENLIFLDQNCDFLNLDTTILDNIKHFNKELPEIDCRNILAQFLFRTDEVFKKVSSISGGEKLRTALACVFAKKESPELIILDEPTNNLDLNGIKILEDILKNYNGTIILVSHDKTFKDNININKIIKL